MSNSRTFLAIYISVATSYLGVGLVAPLIAIVLSDKGADSFTVGLVGTTMFAAFTIASFPIGNLTDRIGAKPVLVGGLFVYGFAVFLFALVGDTWLFFPVRAAEGIGGAAISVATETMIGHHSDSKERGRRMSYYALAVGIGWAAGPLAGTLLYGIRPATPFIACFALSALAGVMVLVSVPQTSNSSHRIAGLFSGLPSTIVVPVSAGALYGYLMSSLVTLFPLYLRALRVDERAMGSIITAVIVGTIVSQVPIGRAADRFGKRPTLFVCAVVLSGAFVLMAQHSDWRAFLVTGAVAGALAGSFYPIGLALLAGLVGRERLGAATSLFSLAFGIGSLIGPSLSGLAMNHLGNAWLFYLPSTLTVTFAAQIILLYARTAPSRNNGTAP